MMYGVCESAKAKTKVTVCRSVFHTHLDGFGLVLVLFGGAHPKGSMAGQHYACEILRTVVLGKCWRATAENRRRTQKN
jgi:hypothetical protein